MPKKLLFLSPHTNPGSGGVKVIFRFAQFFAERDYEVTVAAPKVGNYWEITGGRQPSFKLVQVKELSKKYLPETQCIINFCDGISWGPMPGCPHILFLQGFGTQSYEREVVNLLYPYTCVIATSAWLADLSAKSGHETYIVPPGLDTHFVPTKVPKLGVTTIGTLYHTSPAKNVGMFNAAMNRVNAQFSGNVKALFLSSKLPEEPLKAMDGLQFVYSFVMNPPQKLLPTMYSSCHVWASPSLNEGFGLTTLEAMACGVPVVTVRNRGLDAFLKNKENCLISEDAKGMADCISLLMSDAKLRATVIAGGMNLASQFNWKNSVDKFVAVLNAVGM